MAWSLLSLVGCAEHRPTVLVLSDGDAAPIRGCSSCARARGPTEVRGPADLVVVDGHNASNGVVAGLSEDELVAAIRAAAPHEVVLAVCLGGDLDLLGRIFAEVDSVATIRAAPRMLPGTPLDLDARCLSARPDGDRGSCLSVAGAALSPYTRRDVAALRAAWEAADGRCPSLLSVWPYYACVSTPSASAVVRMSPSDAARRCRDAGPPFVVPLCAAGGAP